MALLITVLRSGQAAETFRILDENDVRILDENDNFITFR